MYEKVLQLNIYVILQHRTNVLRKNKIKSKVQYVIYDIKGRYLETGTTLQFKDLKTRFHYFQHPIKVERVAFAPKHSTKRKIFINT